MKKIILLGLLLTGICGCPCFNSSSKWNVKNFTYYIYDLKHASPKNDTIHGDSIILNLVLEPQFVQQEYKTQNIFINTANALTCETPGDQGLMDPIKEFQLTSNAKFNQYEPGELLNNIISIDDSKSIDQFISEDYIWAYNFFQRLDLIITQKPKTGSDHKFKIRFIFESGKVIEKETDLIHWI